MSTRPAVGWRSVVAAMLLAGVVLTGGATVFAHQINWMPHVPVALVSI